MSWHRVESAFFLRHGEGKRRRSLPSTRACSRSKMKSHRGRAGRRGGARVSREYRRLRAFPIWGIHIQTKSTFICGINGVGGGGGGKQIILHTHVLKLFFGPYKTSKKKETHLYPLVRSLQWNKAASGGEKRFQADRGVNFKAVNKPGLCGH